MSNEEYKTVKDVFKDYYFSNQILAESKIKSINLFKKTNSLELILCAEKLVKIRDIYSFENYLEVRFGIKTIQIKVETENELENIEKNIVDEWEGIVEYISNKHPMTKAILKESKIEIEEKEIRVLLSLKGREFLIAKKFDEILSNIYGKKYKVNYIEDISEETLKRRQEEVVKLQKQAILEVQKESEMVKEEKEESNQTNNGNNDLDFMPYPDIPFDDKDMPVSEEEYLQELEQLEEEKNVILGTLSKAKENKVRIKDISPDNKKITIEGRIVTCDIRETKTGKGMLIYDLYDGTGILHVNHLLEI